MTPAKCMNPRCERQARTRGLCSACYMTAARMIRDGRTTWAQLEAAGKVRPKRYVASWIREPGSAR